MRSMEKKLHKRHALLTLSLLTAVTLFVYNPVVRGIDRFVNGSLDDAYAIIWQIWWFKHSIAELGQNPFFTDFVEAPYGVSLTYTTLSNHLIAFPMTWAFGPVASYNVMILLSFILSGLGMYLVTRHVIKDAAPSVFSALLYAFSPYHTVFSGAGGMDAAQIQYLPFMLLFLLRYEASRSIRDLVFLLFFLAMSIFSFGYYAVLAFLTVIVFLIYFRALPFLSLLYKRPGDPARDDPGPGLQAGKTALFIIAGYLLLAFAGNSLEEASFYTKSLLFVSIALAAYVSAVTPGGALKRLLTELGSIAKRIDRRHRYLGITGGALGALMVSALLLPVFSHASRRISFSYIVPYYSYLVPPPSHPVFANLVPPILTPGPDPLSGRFVYVGATLLFLSIFASIRLLKNTGERVRRDDAGFMAVLFMTAVSLTLPPDVQVGSFTFHGPVHYLHRLVPPFVDVRRVVVLLLLSGCVLAGAGLKVIAGAPGGRLRKALIHILVFAFAALEYYPAIDIKDTDAVTSPYRWLKDNASAGGAIEYPLTSSYDSRRYEAFFGQTIHAKRLSNTFGSLGHEPRPENEELKALFNRGGPVNELLTNPENAASVLSSSGVRYLIVRTDKLPPGAFASGDEGLKKAASFRDSEIYEIKASHAPAYISFTDFYRSGYFLNYLKKVDGAYVLKNPFFLPNEITKDGIPWLWMGQRASLRVVKITPDKNSMDLHFRAVSKSTVRLKVASSERILKEFDVTPTPSEFVIEGLPAGLPNAPLTLRLEVSGDKSPVYYSDNGLQIGGALEKGEGNGVEKHYLGVGIRDAVLKTSHGGVGKIDASNNEAKRLKAEDLDGFFVTPKRL